MSYGPWQSVPGGYSVKMSELKPTVVVDASLTIDVVYAAPGGKVCLNDFEEHRGSGGNILYWQFARVGPGVHKTTYTIWDDIQD